MAEGVQNQKNYVSGHGTINQDTYQSTTTYNQHSSNATFHQQAAGPVINIVNSPFLGGNYPYYPPYQPMPSQSHSTQSSDVNVEKHVPESLPLGEEEDAGVSKELDDLMRKAIRSFLKTGYDRLKPNESPDESDSEDNNVTPSM